MWLYFVLWYWMVKSIRNLHLDWYSHSVPLPLESMPLRLLSASFVTNRSYRDQQIFHSAGGNLLSVVRNHALLSNWLRLSLGEQNSVNSLASWVTTTICKTVTMALVLHGSETWSLRLREEHRLSVQGHRALRKISGSGEDQITWGSRKLNNEELQDLYAPPPKYYKEGEGGTAFKHKREKIAHRITELLPLHAPVSWDFRSHAINMFKHCYYKVLNAHLEVYINYFQLFGLKCIMCIIRGVHYLLYWYYMWLLDVTCFCVW
jgi:hypothetical protein